MRLDIITLWLIALELVKIKTHVRGINALEFNAGQHRSVYILIPVTYKIHKITIYSSLVKMLNEDICFNVTRHYSTSMVTFNK